MDRKYVLTALGYALVGLVLGIYMAASKNHGQLVAHAHIMLVGFVVSFIYSVIYKAWLTDQTSKLCVAQYICHQVGALVLVSALFCMYGNYADAAVLGPILGISSILVLIGMILMKIIFIKQTKNS
ncbi:TonB-dependent receptor [Paraglaciecola aquimarina]|uniref:TonB-dependent receptor n=1 Tax=Paraglaciecola algarum TaxID=3050085 RepID=A0ABS9D9B7_9ALTE|nr:TonB-dependent receptor [Paraglaciecola sp. G1-23]MCF2949476.1 TonB-dependent receptor [Paraglaciecola sp. G1-23]